MLGILSLVFTTAISFQFFGGDEWGQADNSFAPNIKEVYVPIGFDNNDLVQLIVEVEFSDTCQEIGRAMVLPHEDNHFVLQLYVEAHRRDGFCLQVINRQIKVVDVGVLPEGQYEIRSYRKLHRRFSDLRVREAKTAKIDDNVYAPVDSLIIQKDSLGVRRVLTLSGTFTNTCLDVEKVIVAKTRKNLIEVLPIVSMRNDIPCVSKDVPFLVSQVIPEFEGERRITSGRYLFHVRTMNGGSFNKTDFLVMEAKNEDAFIP